MRGVLAFLESGRVEAKYTPKESLYLQKMRNLQIQLLPQRYFDVRQVVFDVPSSHVNGLFEADV